MSHFLKSIIDWMLEKEESMAKECAIPMKEIESQIEKVQKEKVIVEKKYEDAINELDEVLKRLEKIKNTEILRCKLK
jgi:tRNA A-37 threonylcarbamoyl transferase component Bud32